MSSCRHGGRDVYERPDVIEREQMECYRFKAAFTDSEPIGIVFARKTSGGERHFSHFETEDGSIRYTGRRARDFDNIEEVVE